jgi:IS5 family transposase
MQAWIRIGLDPLGRCQAANVHDLTPASELLHDDEEVVYDDAGYQGIG